MPRTRHVHLDVRDVVLTDSRTGRPYALGAVAGAQAVTLVRHRY